MVYSIPFICTLDTKLRAFQHKILLRYLPTNILLNKMKVAESDMCCFCGDEVETLLHLFCNCDLVRPFWQELNFWCQNNVETRVKTTQLNIILGIVSRDPSFEIQNLIILLAKYHIFQAKLNNTRPNFNIFKKMLKKTYLVEFHIALNRDLIQKNLDKWRNLTMVEVEAW